MSMMPDDDVLEVSTELANEIEKLLNGKEVAAVFYAIGMVIAHLQSAGGDPETAMDWLQKIADFERQRQFSMQ